MSFLINKKDHISSFAALAGTTLSLIALGITAYSLRDMPKSPDLVLQIAASEDKEVRIVTYNGGDAPCAEFKITYPKKLGSVEQIVQYQESVITNAKIVKNKIVLPPHAFTKVGKCKGDICTINGGFLKPNQVFALRTLSQVDSFSITASCIDDSITETYKI